MGMPILGSAGVKPDMKFVCCDCGDEVTGAQIIGDHVRMHIVHVDKQNPQNSTLRCELCQEEKEEQYADSFDDSY